MMPARPYGDGLGQRRERPVDAVGHLRELHVTAGVGESVKGEVVCRQRSDHARRAVQPDEVAALVAPEGHRRIVVVEHGLRAVAVVEETAAAVEIIREPCLALIPFGMYDVTYFIYDVVTIVIPCPQSTDGRDGSGEDGSLASHIFHAPAP